MEGKQKDIPPDISSKETTNKKGNGFSTSKKTDEGKGKVVKRRRTMTRFTKEQYAILEAAFAECWRLDNARCEELMKLTGIERKAVIRVWFHNRRVKAKKLERREAEKMESSELTSPPAENPTPMEVTEDSAKETTPHSQTKPATGKRKPKVLKFRYPRGPRKKNRTPPRMMPLPKIPDSPHRGPPDITLPLSELKFMLTCKICKGYLYNATTLTECLHSFCKACLLDYVTRNLHCPTCKLLIHPSNPYLNIRIDHTVQDIVYKILPNVQEEEKKNEEEFYVSRGLPYPPKVMQPTTPPPVESVESEDESETSDESDESESEDFEPPKWTSLLLQFAGASEGLGTFQPIEKNFIRVSSEVTVEQIRKLVKLKMKLFFNTKVQVYMFVDTTLVHDSLTLDEIKELFFTDEEDELIIMQYGIVSAQRNLFEELAVARSAIDFSEDDEDEELTEKNYIYGDDVLNCDYEFLTRTVEPNIDFPVIKRGQIEVESETDEPTPRLLLESDSESESDDDSLVRQSAHW